MVRLPPYFNCFLLVIFSPSFPHYYDYHVGLDFSSFHPFQFPNLFSFLHIQTQAPPPAASLLGHRSLLHAVTNYRSASTANLPCQLLLRSPTLPLARAAAPLMPHSPTPPLVHGAHSPEVGWKGTAHASCYCTEHLVCITWSWNEEHGWPRPPNLEGQREPASWRYILIWVILPPSVSNPNTTKRGTGPCHPPSTMQPNTRQESRLWRSVLIKMPGRCLLPLV